MKTHSLILRPISQFISKPRYFTSSSTTTSDIKIEIKTILNTSNTVEPPLETLVPSLSHDVVNSILQEQDDIRSSFRFFIWAMKRKEFRSWVSHNSMIDILCESNGFELGWKLLEELKDSGITIVSHAFTVIIAAYAKLDMIEKAVETFGKMNDFNCRPNTFTYNTILHLLVEKEVFILALAVYNQMVKTDCWPNQATYGILIDGLCKAGKPQDALQLFDEMTQRGISPNTMIYTIIVSGLCQANRTDDALELVDVMKSNGYMPDFITYNTLLNGFCKLGRLDESLELLESFKTEGFVLGLHGYSCLIDWLFRAGRFDEACEWYRMMNEEEIVPDCILYTIMIKGFTEAGKVDDAVKLLTEMTERDFVPDTFCYNTLIKGFCDMGLLDEARSLKLEISRNDCFPDSATYTILICGLCKEGFVQEAKEIFSEMEKYGCYRTVMTFNALINGLCKAGELEAAKLLFCEMEIGGNPAAFLRLSQGADRVLKPTDLQARVERLCDDGLILDAYKLLIRLADSGVVPNVFTYNILINALCKARNIEGALQLFKKLKLMKGYSPDAVTYGTLIDGLQRVNREEDALALFDQMGKSGCPPTVVTYKTLMTWFCRKGKVDLAFSYWMKYLRGEAGEEETIKEVEDKYGSGDIEGAIRGLLEMNVGSEKLDSSPYTIWLIGLCREGRVDKALKIFSTLEEYNIEITPPSCVSLINQLCEEGKLDLAIDVFQYTLEKGFKLMPAVCNRLIRSLFSQERKKPVFDLLNRMKSADYDMDFYLQRSTKSLLQSGRILEA